VDEVSNLLVQWSRGDSEAFDKLMPLVYSDLRRLAGSYLRRERPGHTLQATALVHELFLRLVNRGKVDWESRSHFFLYAGHLMRLILREWARKRHAEKRGGYAIKTPLNEELAWVNADGPEMLDLDRAIDDLKKADSRKAQIVELRFFLGCTNDEVAELLALSPTTVKREVAFVKGWLYQRVAPSVSATTTDPQ
jgi:RNA polymerase sigma factor (TIGR02999 family)